jgi:hypothetical protein
MADLLLRHSARDDDCKALRVATRNKDDILTAKLLSIKVAVWLSYHDDTSTCLAQLSGFICTFGMMKGTNLVSKTLWFIVYYHF